MTNGENIKSLSNEQLGHFLCRALEIALESTDVFVCDVCPASDYCYPGHNGIEAWLDKESEAKQ